MAIATDDLFLSVEPVQRKFFGLGIKSIESQFSKFFNIESTDNPIKHAVDYGGHRQFASIQDNEAVTMGAFHEGKNKTWRAATYGGGHVLSIHAIKDSKLEQVKTAPAMLGRAGKLTPEYLIATFLGNAFNSSFPATGDGLELCSLVHKLPDDTTTVANETSTAAALEEESLEDVLTSMRQMVGQDNMLSPVTPEHLVVPTDLTPLAWKLTNTTTQVGSANNDLSWVKGKVDVTPFDFLVSQSKWFVTAKNLPSGGMGLFWLWRERLQYVTDNIPMNLQKAYIAYFRAMWGCDDFRAIFGSNAA